MAGEKKEGDDMLELNKVLLIGNLTQDPEVRSLASGTPVADFNLAVNRRYKDKNGERREETLFIQVESWGRQAEFVQEWLKKGRRIFVEGRLKFDSWEGRDGNKRSRIKVTAERIQFADPPPSSRRDDAGGSAVQRREESQSPKPSRQTKESESQPDVTDDDLPF